MGRVYAMIAMHVDHARGARRTNIDLETKIDNHDYMTNDMKLDYCHPIYIEKCSHPLTRCACLSSMRNWDRYQGFDRGTPGKSMQQRQ